ncbi:hypothetical protein Tco_0758975 [Tanacetum coccineum]
MVLVLWNTMQIMQKIMLSFKETEYEANVPQLHEYGVYLFSQETSEIISQAEAEIRNHGVSANRDPAGIDSAGGVSAGRTSAGNDPAGDTPAGSFEPADKSNPAVSSSVSADFNPVYADESTLPPGQSLGSSANTTRFPLPSDVCMDQLSSGIFTSSSYDDDFSATLTNYSDKKQSSKIQLQIQEEIATIHQPASMKLVPFTLMAKHAIGTKWILKNKRDAKRNSLALIEANNCFWLFASHMGLPGIIRWMLRVHFSMEKLKKKCIHSAKRSLKILTSQSMCTEWLKLLYGTSYNHLDPVIKGEFEMSAMGEMTFFLGLQVKQLPDGTFISQDRYVKDMLTKFDMESVRTATTPYEAAKTKLKDETDPPVNVHLYRSMIGSLMYLTASRPDIMFAVSACSRHQVTPLTSHLNAVKKIFKYLKGQPKFGLWYPKDSPFQLEAYSDSDYAGSHGDRKSTTGGCQFLGRRLISWQCKKQTIVATSSTEAEYVAAASCCAQVLWIQNQLLDYGFNFMNTKIFIDNQSTICIVKNPVFHQRTKHIEIRHHFIRDANEKNLIQVLKIHTDDNVADLLTKAFDGPRFKYLVVYIGMLYILPADKLVSAGSTLILLVVILPAGCFVSAGSYGFCWWFRVYAGGHTSAGGFIFADRVNLFLLSPLSFCCAQFDIAGWLVSATSHLVSAGSLQSCWCNNVSAD